MEMSTRQDSDGVMALSTGDGYFKFHFMRGTMRFHFMRGTMRFHFMRGTMRRLDNRVRGSSRVDSSECVGHWWSDWSQCTLKSVQQCASEQHLSQRQHCPCMFQQFPSLPLFFSLPPAIPLSLSPQGVVTGQKSSFRQRLHSNSSLRSM